jgi:hypothetical protein
MPSTALFIHVPVDTVSVTDGPTTVICLWIRDRLAKGEEHVETRMQLQTGASNKKFWRTIKIAHLRVDDDKQLFFTAYFAGQVVGGIYNMQTRKGWFNLE